MTEPSDTVTIVERGDRTWYLVGTAHVSRESVEEVRRVIADVRPDVVAVELCEPRYVALTDENRWANLDIFEVIKQGKMLFLLANLAIGAYQRRLGAQLGVKPGEELLEAVKVAEELDIEFALVDREIHTTLRRAWASVPFFKKLGLLGAIGESLLPGGGQEIDEADIEALKQKAHLSEMMEEFTRALPEVKGALIDERDMYMVAKLREIDAKRVVAVVGAGHVPGMEARFDEPIDVETISQSPPPSAWTKFIKWLVPVAVLAAFAWGYSKHGGQTLEQMLYAWVLPNSIFAALFTAIAGARPLTILVAFIGSPITSLNPLINTGIVAGLTEAWLRKPTVEDAERINDDARSIGGFYRNAFTRTLLVAVLATLGSAIGGWIGAAWVLSLLGG